MVGGGSTAWTEPPSVIGVPQEGEVHVWRFSLEGDEGEVRRRREVLNGAERQRADRFYLDRDRHRFTLARGMLRTLLALYVQCLPEEIAFSYGEQGKPFLDWQSLRCGPENLASRLQFNVSHSGDLAVYAIANQRSVGVDVEQVRTLDCVTIAKRYFAEGEWQELERLPSHQQRRRFFDCWTRKEAYIKAFGKGLSIPLNGFEVSLGADPRLKSTAWRMEDFKRWSMVALELGEQWAGAFSGGGAAIVHLSLEHFSGVLTYQEFGYRELPEMLGQDAGAHRTLPISKLKLHPVAAWTETGVCLAEKQG